MSSSTGSYGINEWLNRQLCYASLEGDDRIAGYCKELLRLVAGGWHPIATAPRDGECERVLLLFDDGKQSVGYYDLYYAEGGRGYDSRYGNDGAWIEPCSGERLMLHYDPPRYWQPLPAPPTTEADDEVTP